MKIAVFETQEWEHSACLGLQPEHEVVCTPDPLNGMTAGEFLHAEAITTFVNSKLDAGVLAHFPKLRLIATRSTLKISAACSPKPPGSRSCWSAPAGRSGACRLRCATR